MPYLRDSRRPEVRPSRLFLLLSLVLLVTCAVLAAPALAYDPWEHGGANESTCDLSGCHKDQTPTNAACTQSGCHTNYTVSGAKKCWDCHEPGSAPTTTCAGSCHLYRANGEHPAYDVAFTHGATPHLGASGYGKTCADCHDDGQHHDATVAQDPACADCHDGTLAKVPPASHNDGQHTDCESCHDGMSLPSCAGCHVDNASSGGPQIAFSNNLSCADATCHGKVLNHVGTPITQAACSECHASHYTELGTCTTCHTDPQTFHHGTSQAVPLNQCATCHNGTIAQAPTGHTGFGTDCVSCHTGMDRPSQGDCAACHIGKPTSSAPQITYSGAKTCADPACHAKVKNHAGTPISAASCTTCHDAHYESLGACTKCHPQPETFHHAAAKPIPLNQCATCHDGGIAQAPKGHASYGATCTSCHKGMDVPSGACLDCHKKQQGKVPPVTYTNDPSCGDAQCHAKVKNHAGTSISAAPCSTCHAPHYQDLGACATCHADPVQYHHGTTKATPLTKCEDCHNGKIAPAQQSHAGMTCSVCHDDMTSPPVPATCTTCHTAATFGAVTCTACHSKDSGLFGDKEQVHLKDPTVACTSCHKPMYTDVGSCDTCHSSHAKAHHATATPAASLLKASVSDRRVKKGARVRVGGTLTGATGPLAGQKVTLQARSSAKAQYKTVSTLTTKADGTCGRLLKPRTSTQYRLIYRAAGDMGLQQRPAVALTRVRVTR